MSLAELRKLPAGEKLKIIETLWASIHMSKKRRQHSAQFKAQVGLEALKGIEPVHAIAAKHAIHPVQVENTYDSRGSVRKGNSGWW